MSATVKAGNNQASGGGPIEAVLSRRRFPSIVWLVPIVAALIGGWLAIVTIREQGPKIIVSFETAEGLEAGKTKVKYRDVDIGHLASLRISDDRRSVEANIEFSNVASKYLTETTTFWVVRPRLDASGVSGLGTLISGAYIEIEPGAPGKQVSRYKALEVPPVVRTDVPGRRFVLQSETLGSIGARTPIYFRGLRVGEVLGYELAENRRTIRSFIFVREPYDKLVLESSHFWASGGLEVTAGTEGFKVRVGSLQSLLASGIEFDSPADRDSRQAAENKVFTFFPNREAIAESAIAEKIPYVFYFDGSIRGLLVGAPVEFRGIRIGTVTAIRAELNVARTTVRIAVSADLEPDRLRGETGHTGADQPYQRYGLIGAMVERGLRAQLRTASLLTGQQFVSLDFHEGEPHKSMDMSGPVPEIPTIPPALDTITSSAANFLEKLDKLPIAELLIELRMASTTLRETLDETKGLVQGMRKDVSPMIADFRGAATAAQNALTQAEQTTASIDRSLGDSSEVRQRLAIMLRELTESARSIRQLADYLERNPESLIKGKQEVSR